MSNQYFPTLPGLAWDIVRAPQFSNIVQTSASGQEIRIATYSEFNARFQWTLTHNYLRLPQGEYQSLFGFFCARLGQYDSFLYKDPNDFKVTLQPIGTGDGVTTTFQLRRSFGQTVQFIYEPNSSYQTYVVEIGGVPTVAYTISPGPNGGALHFSSPPTAGQAITASFGYDWRVRFTDDTAEFNNWMYQLFECKTLKFISTRQ